jgi:hypothetical protein
MARSACISCIAITPTPPAAITDFPDRQRRLKRRLGGAGVDVNNSVFSAKGG